MRDLIDRKSIDEGRNSSRLPSFGPEWASKLIGKIKC